MSQKLLIFIITYKASFRVKDVMDKIPFGYIKNFNYQIYISDDNSNDDTLNYIRDIKKEYPNIVFKLNHNNVGYGANIKRCIRYAYEKKFDYAIMLHGDDQYNAKYIKKMIEKFKLNKQIAAISGSRMKNKLNALKGNMPIYKFVGNIFLTKLFNFFYGTNFSDCHTGYWAYNLNKINKKFFFNADNKFCFDIDLRLLMTYHKLRIDEIMIKTKYGTERSSIHFIYALRYFIKIIKFKILKKP